MRIFLLFEQIPGVSYGQRMGMYIQGYSFSTIFLAILRVLLLEFMPDIM